jgi:hypothetical protein
VGSKVSVWAKNYGQSKKIFAEANFFEFWATKVIAFLA